MTKRKHKQKFNYVFFIRNFMEAKLKDGVAQSTIQEQFETYITTLTDTQLINILICCGNIPDNYAETSSEEKLFTKLTEILTKEALSRIATKAECVKQKSGFQDVTVSIADNVVVCDSKSFRLSRSQNAPNPKDFIKVNDYEEWLERFPKQQRLGGLVCYPCTHEWSTTSAVYRDATDFRLPIVILPYKYIAYLLKYKNNFSRDEFANLWNYRNIFPKRSKYKENYWDNMNRQILLLTRTTKEQYYTFMGDANKKINRAIYQHEKLFKYCIQILREQRIAEILKMTENEAKNALLKEWSVTANKQSERIFRRLY